MLTFNEMAKCLQSNVINDFPDDFEIADELKTEFSESEIRLGVKALSGLLYQLFDVIIDNANTIAPPDKKLDVMGWPEKIYVDLRNPFALLYCTGLHGKYDYDSKCLLINGKELNKIYRKARGKKTDDFIKLLIDSGLVYSTDVKDNKSFNIAKSGIVKVHYPDDDHTIIGLKILSEAISKVKGGAIVEHFMRCDYRILSLPKKYIFDIRDVTKFLPADERDYYIELHELLLSNNCKMETKPDSFIFNYNSKSTKLKVASIHIMTTGCFVKLSSKLISKEPDLLFDAPESIKDAIKAGHECAKKENPDACNPKCIGKIIGFNLDGVDYLKCWHLNFYLPTTGDIERNYIKEWIIKEAASS